MGYIYVEIWAAKAFYIGHKVARPLFPSQRAGPGDDTKPSACMHSEGCATWSVCLSVCLSVYLSVSR